MKFSRSGARAASLALVAAVTVAVAPSATAAGVGTITVDAGGHVTVDTRAASGYLEVTFDSGVEAVRFNYAGGWGSVAAPCGIDVYGYALCPGAQVEQVTFVTSEGNDDVNLRDICIPVTIAQLGAGNDRFFNTNECSQPVQSGVNAGAGDDDIRLPAGANEVLGGTGNDRISGGDSADLLRGGPGHDVIWGAGGHDKIWGEDGNDTLVGNEGNDRLNGGAGNDRFGMPSNDGKDPGNNVVSGGPGVDFADFSYADAAVRISLDNRANDGGGRATGNYRSDIENVTGSPYNDVILGSKYRNDLDGLWGNDRIDGGGGNDRVFGNSGNDRLFGGSGADRVEGYSGDDIVNGGGGKDVVYGDSDKCDSWSCQGGADSISVRDGETDRVACGVGADVVVADRRDVIARDGFMRCERVRR